MILSCIQPSYIPWKGYFHIIQKSDIFVFHDDIQYTKQDWRNRNKIKTKYGSKWLTVPVKGATPETLINDVIIDIGQKWELKHWNMILENYAKSLYFKLYADFFIEAYLKKWGSLSELDIYFTKKICTLLGINHVTFVKSSEMSITGTKTDRLVQICNKLGATSYLSGPSAKNYIEPEKFEKNSIKLEYMEYNYPEYPQLHSRFDPFVSIIDLLFNTGNDAPDYIWGKK